MPDIFDTLMNNLCNISERVQYDAGGADAYGQPPQDLHQKITNWPCRVSTLKAGQEWKINKEASKNRFRIFMRPPIQTDSGVPFKLNTHHWIQVGFDSFNILAVDNPSMLNHHLEVVVEQISP